MKRRTTTWIAACLLAAGLIGCGNDSWSSGDRVLVAKCLYDSHVMAPKRFDVVVFKFPNEPTKQLVPYNYIKRLLGLPGEFFAIFMGRLYAWTPGDGEQDVIPNPEPPESAREEKPSEYKERHRESHAKVTKAFEAGRFTIVQKTPQVMLAMRRIVYDNDFPARDLEGLIPERWAPRANSGWAAEKQRAFRFDGDKAPKGQADWLRYQHLVRRPLTGPVLAANVKPELISDIMSYNTVPSVRHDLPRVGAISVNDLNFQGLLDRLNWVGDLMLECEVESESGQGEFRIELSKATFRYQARFNLESGVCTLVKIDSAGKETELDKRDTRLRGAGKHQVRFANIDARLTVWVDRDLPFNDGVSYPPPDVRAPGETIDDDELNRRRGPTANDLEPASVGALGAKLRVSAVRLWRDTYYTGSPALSFENANAWRSPDDQEWQFRQKAAPALMYIYPGHYVCLGDNSQASSDSREWGQVPERLLLGRALMVYYPLHRAGIIR